MPGSFEINHLKIKIYAFLNSYSSYSDYFIYQTWGFPFAASNTVRAAFCHILVYLNISLAWCKGNVCFVGYFVWQRNDR